MARRRRPTLALAGAGMISVVHAMAAAASGWDIVAVASRTEARAVERARQTGASACRYEDLPGEAAAVVVSTPPSRHAADTVAAVEAGAAVLVEKPLATTLADADRIVDAADRTGRPVVYAENLAFSPVVQRAVSIARELGPLRHIGVRCLQPRPDWGDFLDPAWGGGVLFDLGVHPVAVALLLAGDDPVVAVRARLERGADVAVDDHATAELQLASGGSATVECSWRHPSVVWDLQAASDTGVVTAELQPATLVEHDGEAVDLPRPAEVDGLDPRLERLGYVEQLRRLRGTLQGDDPVFDPRFGRHVLEVIMAAYTSAARGGATESLPFTGRRDRTAWELWTGV